MTILKILISINTLDKNKKECRILEDEVGVFDIYYHKNMFPNYKFIELGIELPIDIPKDEVTNDLKMKYLLAITKMFKVLNYVDYYDITTSYLKGMLIQYLQQYDLNYAIN
jgi:hypothetical protein